ncbi:MAG: hypothetical protein ABEH58_01830 [Haloplanus sp.]
MTGSALLTAAVPAVCWAISYPLTAALFVAVAVAAGVRTLRSRGADADTTDPRAVDAAGPAESR